MVKFTSKYGKITKLIFQNKLSCKNMANSSVNAIFKQTKLLESNKEKLRSRPFCLLLFSRELSFSLTLTLPVWDLGTFTSIRPIILGYRTFCHTFNLPQAIFAEVGHSATRTTCHRVNLPLGLDLSATMSVMNSLGSKFTI